ncbi:MAG: ABC transporter ATP-binding protein [Clostridia bacterium]|nr:ABC transporter ATP-binding protein [Clostridia bacterium]
MKRLLKYLGGYKKETVLSPLFKLCEAALELTVPLVIAAIIDNGIHADNTGYVVGMCLLLVLLGAIGLGFSVTAQYYAAVASVGFIAKVRHALFAKVQSLSYRDLDKLGTSTIITRMTSDSQKVQNGLNLTLRLLLRSPFVVFGAMIMAFTVNPAPSVSFAIAIPVLSVIVFGIMLITMPMYKRVQGGTDAVLSLTRENLAGARVVRAFCKEESEISDFSKKNASLTDMHKRVGMISSLMNPLTYVVINLAILLLVYLGAIEVDTSGGAFTQGEVIALYNYMSQILVELIKLANLIITISRAIASADRVADVLDIVPSETPGSVTECADSTYAVEFRSAGITYDGAAEPALSPSTFKVRWGETVGIIGGTGSGKSTLVSLIPALYRATEGEVLVGGVNVNEYSEEALRDLVGIVPQRAVLFRGTIGENMRWAKPEASDGEIYEALKIAQADGIVRDKGGLDAEIEEGGGNLSGGQKQRLTIARALVGEPRILILDDSASALDLATDARLRTALRESLSGTTVFIVSQRTSSIMHADKIIVLDDGEISAIGPHDELLRDSDIYREIYNSQYGGAKENG